MQVYQSFIFVGIGKKKVRIFLKRFAKGKLKQAKDQILNFKQKKKIVWD